MDSKENTQGVAIMQGQLKPAAQIRAKKHKSRPEFTAAVRYLDGRSDIFRVLNADDMADARALVLSELGKVQSLVIALRH